MTLLSIALGTQILLASVLMASGLGRAKLARIRPSRVFVEANGPLNVSCTLNPELAQNLTSDTLSFYWKYRSQGFQQVQKIPTVYIRRSNATTANLLLPQITESHDRYVLSCHVNNHSADTVYIRVGKKPKPSRIVSVSVDNWNLLTLTWTKEKNRVFRTRTNAYWKSNDQEDFKQCLNQEVLPTESMDKVSCSAELRNVQLDSTTFFIIKINSSNELGNTSTKEKYYYLADINKPATVYNFNQLHTGSDWVDVEWQSPADGRSLLYILNISCPYLSKVFNVEHTTEQFITRKLTGLQSGTTCTIAISVRSEHGNIWSDPQIVKITTKDRVPSGLPLTTRGAFDTSEVDFLRHVTLYWQPIPVLLSGGNITHYKVMIKSKDKVSYEEIDAKECKYNDKLNKSLSYNFTVMGKTSAGYNDSLHLPVQVVVLPQSLLEAQRPNNVTAIVNSANTTEIRWDTKADGTFTGYWCASDGKTCTGTITWETAVSSPWKVQLSPMADPKRFRFGVSWDLDTSSSGISWAACVNNMNSRSMPPKVDNKTFINSISLELDEPACVAYSGFVYGYKITYCIYSDHGCDGNLKTMVVGSSGKTTSVELTKLEENTKYKVSVYSMTAAGISGNPFVNVVATQTGTKTVIVSNLHIFLTVGLPCLGLLIVGIIFACIYCRNTCLRIIQQLKIPIRLPEETPPELPDSDGNLLGYAVPYHNLSNGSAPQVEVQKDGIPPYSKIAKPLPPLSLHRHSINGNDSGVSSLEDANLTQPIAVSSPSAEAPALFNNPVFGQGSGEDAKEQNQLNNLKDEDYNYAQTTLFDPTKNLGTDGPSSEESSSSGDEIYKEATILIDEKALSGPSSIPIRSSFKENQLDSSDSSYGYKPAFFSEPLKQRPKKSNILVVSEGPEHTEAKSVLTKPWEWANSEPSSLLSEPVPLLLNTDLAISIRDTADVDEHEDVDSMDEDQDEDNSDYGYAPSSSVV